MGNIFLQVLLGNHGHENIVNDDYQAFGDFQELDEYDIANALGFWSGDHNVYWQGTFTITKNGVSTEYDA